MAKFICFEGADFQGKTTQSKLLQDYLVRKGFKSCRVKVPVNDIVLYKLIYWMLSSGYAKKLPIIFQFIQFLNKFLWQFFVVPYLWLTNDFIVIDRWSPSSIIYGSAEGCPIWYVKLMSKLLFKPTLTLVYSGSTRKRSSTVDDSYESDRDLQHKVRERYANWASDSLNSSKKTTIIINNDKSIDYVHINTIDVVMKFFKGDQK